ncbi:hypothetical protein N7457_005010 [Penicillium paradoxum]|uniref:uncharacterized protein n=1 Tax=Penicillium paradoxum TaxID=176176 RepID=UPI00254973AD|nr:uncharacterized protein N7457_005010 [Penicillium paradoxum]KAJ5783236.1 hypothetical protein N7457_005010 [Penicillium paradoxum]
MGSHTDMDHIQIPIIETEEPLFDVLPKLFNFIRMAVGDMAYTFEQMLHGSQGHRLRQLVHALAEDSHNPFIIVALMILKWDFTTATEDNWGLNESRGAACEFVAWQFLCHLNQRETIEFLLEELPLPQRNSTNTIETEGVSPGLAFSHGDTLQAETETTPLLPYPSSSFYRLFGGKRTTETQLSGSSQGTYLPEEVYATQRYSQFFGLNALEIATIAHAKRFLSQHVVQRVVDGIWKGEIVFWDSLTVKSTKKPHIFNARTADPYSRLRVPLYRKIFEAAFFMSFLFLYYAVLVERRQEAIGIFEAIMYVWIVAFAYDELSGVIDAGVVFYQMDFWSLWNVSIIGVGLAFVITRVIGLVKESESIIDLSFDILSLEALFLVPRHDCSICSLVSLNSYFGSLIPVLKEMTKAFFRFLPVVVVLYIGFLTTFTMLARDRLSLDTMSHLLVKVFFGSSVLGLDTASEISPIFGYGLMLTFALMTNTLILSSLISLMSMSLEGVMRHAREEYLFQLAIYVLESSNSRRLTYFMPPLVSWGLIPGWNVALGVLEHFPTNTQQNLIPLLCIRPMRLFLSAGTVRRVRIVLLRATHLPFVALIWAYESKWRHSKRQNSQLPPMWARGQRTSANEPTEPRFQDPHHPSVVETNRLGLGKERISVDHQAARGPDMGQLGQVPQLADLIDTVERLRAQVEAIAGQR